MTRNALEDHWMRILKYLAVCLFATLCLAQSHGKFELIADYRGIGGANATAVGPGPVPGSERLYISYTYSQNTFDVLSVDPETGSTKVFTNPVPGEWAGYGLVAGPDGNIYLGTAPKAHFVKLDPKRGTFVDLGRPAPSEEWIFDAAFGSDGRLYGCTYPSAKLVRYTPQTGALADLGRLDPTEQYARYIVASNDGFLYIGIGSAKANVAVYEIATMEQKEILPADAQNPEITHVYQGQDGNIYASVANRVFRLNHWTATEITSGAPRPPEHIPALRDGRIPTVTYDRGHLKVAAAAHTNNKGDLTHEVTYEGRRLSLFRIAFGPDNALYGSSVLPIHLVQFDQAHHSVSEIGDLGAGEIYSFLNHGGRLLMGAYAAQAPLMFYKPEAPFYPGPAGSGGNPVLYSPKGIPSAWRPMAMVDGPDHQVYIGSIATYGQLESPLLKFNPESATSTIYPVVHDQSIDSLRVWHNLIIGGTSVRGGAGSHPTQSSACIFAWNQDTGRKEFEVVPVPGKAAVTDLIVAPNGHIFGFADNVLFVFDPSSKTVISRQTVPFSPPIYESVGLDHSGTIWGLAKEGIFTINAASLKVQLTARPPADITGGFAMRDGKIYFIAGSSVYSYSM
jgi:outer membrane protein assembly factor BamB